MAIPAQQNDWLPGMITIRLLSETSDTQPSASQPYPEVSHRYLLQPDSLVLHSTEENSKNSTPPLLDATPVVARNGYDYNTIAVGDI